MPRGPGERRGGRQKGSLNKLSISGVNADIATATPEFNSPDQLRLVAKHFLDQATAEGKKKNAKAADAASRWHVRQRSEGAAKEPYINHLLE
jgi:hypothetical protein